MEELLTLQKGRQKKPPKKRPASDTKQTPSKRPAKKSAVESDLAEPEEARARKIVTFFTVTLKLNQKLSIVEFIGDSCDYQLQRDYH